jgi:hypothetical protein
MFGNLIEGVHSVCASFAEYLCREVGQTGYFDIAPVSAIQRVSRALEQGLFILGQLNISLLPETRTEVVDQNSRERISAVNKDLLNLCTITDGHAKDAQTRACFERVRLICTRTFEPSFSTPTATPEFTQPDQVLVHADDPQEPDQQGKTP